MLGYVGLAGDHVMVRVRDRWLRIDKLSYMRVVGDCDIDIFF